MKVPRRPGPGTGGTVPGTQGGTIVSGRSEGNSGLGTPEGAAGRGKPPQLKVGPTIRAIKSTTGGENY